MRALDHSISVTYAAPLSPSRPVVDQRAEPPSQLFKPLFSYNFVSSDVWPTVRNFFLGHKLGRSGAAAARAPPRPLTLTLQSMQR